MRAGLPQHLSFCEIQGRFIFLNRRDGRYFTLSARTGEAFAELRGAGKHTVADAELDHLFASGILEPDGRALRECAARNAEESLDLPNHTLPGLGVAGAAVSLARATAALRCRKLDSVLNDLSAGKGLRGRTGPEAQQELIRVAAAFRHLGLYITPKDRCLPISLAIARALSDNSVFADLILGVAVEPFRAHAWVQLGGLVINDTVDQVRGFKPILVV